MKVTLGYRCDSCGRVEPGHGFLKDEDGEPQAPFKKFSVVKWSPEGGVETGIAMASQTKLPAVLHACPGCEKKVTAAVDEGKIMGLPDGPLRKILIVLRSKDRLKHTLKLV